MTSPRCDQTVAWAALGGHYQAHGADLDLRTLFADDPRRVEALTFEAPEVVVDMSRVHWDVATRHRCARERLRCFGAFDRQAIHSDR